MLAEDELLKLLSKHPKIYTDILDLFKNPKAALNWLKKPRKQLCNATPLSVLERNPTLVEELIYTIKTGDFS